MSLSDLKMFTNGIDYVIAEDLEEAKDILCQEYYGPNISYKDLDLIVKKELDGTGWKQKNNDETFTLYQEFGGGITRTIAYWIKEEGRGFFASS